MKVFLSYASPDASVAKALVRDLTDAGLDVWDPDTGILPGENWASKIGEAIEKSDIVLVLLSPDSLESRWIRGEIDYVLGTPKFRNRLLPVVVRPTNKIPWILQRLPLVHLEDTPVDAGQRVLQGIRQLAAIA